MNADLLKNLKVEDIQRFLQLQKMGLIPEQKAPTTKPSLSKKERAKLKKENRKMEKLVQKFGRVSEKDFAEARERISKNKYKSQDLKNRDANLIKVYQSQGLPKEISLAEADAMLPKTTDEVSSDLSSAED